jgi:MarR family protein
MSGSDGHVGCRGHATRTRFSPERLRELFHRKTMAGKRHRATAARLLGMDETEAAALAHLAQHGQLTPGELGALLVLTSGGTTALIHRLVEGGHLVRHPHPRDRPTARQNSNMETYEVIATVIGFLGVCAAALGIYVNRQNHKWQKQRDEERRGSNIVIGATEKSGFVGEDLVVGERLPLEHLLIVEAANRAEVPAYVSEVWLEPKRTSPVRVSLRKARGTEEIQPGNSSEFALPLDGSQAFPWDEPFRICVKLANGATFASPCAALGQRPHHGRMVEVVDPEAVLDDQVQVPGPEDLIDPRSRD